MCGWLAVKGFSETPLHFSRFYPNHKLTQLPPTPVNILKSARETALKEGLKYVYTGNIPGLGSENTICPTCGKTMIERKGFNITLNDLKDGKCSSCNTIIHGIWNS
jgi:pyruvate formate lyase activating enzyme